MKGVIVDSFLDASQDALNRMRRASHRGTGCHLTKEMIDSLELTVIGEMWKEEDPRDIKKGITNVQNNG